MNTIVAETSGIYKDKGSKFLSFAEPIESEEQIQRQRKQIFEFC